MDIGSQIKNVVPYVDTVRSLHQTVTALRAALEESKKEILNLKSKSWPINTIEQSLTALAIENHALKRKLLDKENSTEQTSIDTKTELKSDKNEGISKENVSKTVKFEKNDEIIESVEKNHTSEEEISKDLDLNELPSINVKINGNINGTENKSGKKHIKLPKLPIKSRKNRIKATISIKTKSIDKKNLESLTIVKTPKKQLSLYKTTNFLNINSKISCKIKDMSNSSKNQQTTTITTNDDEENLNEQEQEPEVDDIELIFTTDDTKESDFKEQLVSIDSIDQTDGENDRNNKLLRPDEQSIDISDRELDDDVFEHENQLKRDNSTQLYNSKSDNSINLDEKSFKSYSSFENRSIEKDESFDRFEEKIRIVETDISKIGIQEIEYSGIRRNTCPNPLQYRPLLHREAITKGLNVKKTRPILAHSNAIRKDSGAQTDISALPGSTNWRSDGNLANKSHLGENFTIPSKFPLQGSRLRLSEKTVEARRVLLSDIGFTSMVPELSRSADHLCPSALKPPTTTTYGQFLRTPELYSPAYTSQRFTWTTTTATPSDGSRFSIQPLSPPVQMRRCSAPVSPSRRVTLKSIPSKVRFANGSLPELRGDWTQITGDSGDSTDSLVDEAENYLRRSIDCILNKTEYGGENRRNIPRRASAPVPISDNIPPQGWQPFLPRQPRDLKLEHWVKVITSEGKVKGGRVRYIGPVASQIDTFIGVQLAVPEGFSDGTYNTRRYFQCEPYHGTFVPFKKVIMGWRP